MLTRIRNGLRGRKAQINVKRSGVCMGVAQVLKAEGYIQDFVEVPDETQGEIRITLKYGERGESVIQDLQRDSKPGRRVYRGYTKLPRVLDGLGIAILSTSSGVMSDRQCRQKKVGGELLCTVW